MNIPRLRRGGGIFKFSFFCIGTSIYFVCDSASELERWALLSFLGFSCPNLLNF